VLTIKPIQGRVTEAELAARRACWHLSQSTCILLVVWKFMQDRTGRSSSSGSGQGGGGDPEHWKERPAMNLNADFTRRAVVHAATLDWKASPMPGVQRRMLDRIGDEVARATSIVRYAADSCFSPHVHGGGEEFLVLDGVFQDEHGDFPAGSYVRNPPRSHHTPGSKSGCTLFVKLCQFDPTDRTHVLVDTNRTAWLDVEGRDGVKAMPLFRDAREDVRLERWAPGAAIELDPDGGLEVLVLEGGFEEGGETYRAQSWLRLPIGAHFSARVAADGCRVWIKEGHLRHVQAGQPTG
jgi:hypothetical protein